MNQVSPEQLQQMQAMLAQGQQPVANAVPGQMPSMQPAQQGGITGISIPVKLNSPMGSVKCLVHFGAESANPMGAQMAMQQLQAMGLQIDAWQPKQNGGGWNNGGGRGGNRGGWNNGGWS